MNLEFFPLNDAIASVPSKSNYSAFLMSAGEMVAISSSGIPRRLFKLGPPTVGIPLMGDHAIPGSSTLGLFRLVRSDHFWLLLDVSTAVQSKSRIPAYGTGRCQTVQSRELVCSLDFCSGEMKRRLHTTRLLCSTLFMHLVGRLGKLWLQMRTNVSGVLMCDHLGAGWVWSEQTLQY